TERGQDQGAGEGASAVETAGIVLLRPSYCCALGWCPIATTRRTVKLQFDPNQTYQLDAIRAVVDLFEGQPQGEPEYALIKVRGEDDLFSGQERTELG